jgi:hypothetical protein
MNLDDISKATHFNDSACTCKLCDHRIALECKSASCICCRGADHSMVLDGIEGFTARRNA